MNNTTIPDTGNISVTINDAMVVVPWQSGSTAQAIATQLQSQLQQAGGGFLQVTRSGSTLSLSSSIASADANWPILYSITDTSSQTPSFTLSDTGMSGGSNPTVVAPTTSPGATLLYSYSIPAFNPTNMASSGYLANGNLQNVTDSVMGNWSYQYDDLNRLKQANASANPQTGFAPYGAAQLNWGYDSFGDYKGTALSGSTGFSMPQVAYSYNGVSLQNGTALTGVANNRIDGYNYDASGDLLSDPLGGQNYYVYDAEGRVSMVGSSVKYVYDAEGRRVAKESVSGGSATVTNQYVLGLGGEQVSELNGSGSWIHSNVYAGGKLLATYNSAGLHFHFTDWLGTNRIQTSGTGMLEESCLSLPFGDMLNCSGSDSTEQHFTGKERDTESGLDYFGARYYASSMGRWISPDWSAKEEPVPYAKLDNPQSLNLYAYVGNNPLSRVDPDGHACTAWYGNSGWTGSSGFCDRAAEYAKFDANPAINSRTRFFGAAATVSNALGDVDAWRPGTFITGVSNQTRGFLEGVGRTLQSFNEGESHLVATGALGSGAALDRQLVHNEQSVVQGALDGLKSSDLGAYNKTIGEINGSLNGLVSKGLQQIAPSDRAYAAVLKGVAAGLPDHKINFANQGDREAIGNALAQNLRNQQH